MNRTHAVFIIICLLVGIGASSARWIEMSTSTKPVKEAYITENGTLGYGPFCSREGELIDGGIVCHVDELSRPYDGGERIRSTIGTGLAGMAVALLLLLWLLWALGARKKKLIGT